MEDPDPASTQDPGSLKEQGATHLDGQDTADAHQCWFQWLTLLVSLRAVSAKKFDLSSNRNMQLFPPKQEVNGRERSEIVCVHLWCLCYREKGRGNEA